MLGIDTEGQKEVIGIWIDKTESAEVIKDFKKNNIYNKSIDLLNSALRKVTRGKGSFINKITLMKVLFLRVENLKKKWCQGSNNWRNVQNQLSIIFEDRYTKHL